VIVDLRCNKLTKRFGSSIERAVAFLGFARLNAGSRIVSRYARRPCLMTGELFV
jgi:hypothetical protein